MPSSDEDDTKHPRRRLRRVKKKHARAPSPSPSPTHSPTPPPTPAPPASPLATPSQPATASQSTQKPQRIFKLKRGSLEVIDRTDDEPMIIKIKCILVNGQEKLVCKYFTIETYKDFKSINFSIDI